MSLNNNIYILGFMGAGKTEVGKLLAKRLNRTRVDTDSAIESQTGTSISNIFDNRGEDFFRDMESKVIDEVARIDNLVVSCGGGIVIRKKNMKQIANSGISVFLDASPETIFKRLENVDDRPKLAGYAEVIKLRMIGEILSERMPLYGTSDITINCNDKSLDQIVDEIVEALLNE